MEDRQCNDKYDFAIWQESRYFYFTSMNVLDKSRIVEVEMAGIDISVILDPKIIKGTMWLIIGQFL